MLEWSITRKWFWWNKFKERCFPFILIFSQTNLWFRIQTLKSSSTSCFKLLQKFSIDKTSDDSIGYLVVTSTTYKIVNICKRYKNCNKRANLQEYHLIYVNVLILIFKVSYSEYSRVSINFQLTTSIWNKKSPNKKGHKQKWSMLFFTSIKPETQCWCVLVHLPASN